MAVNLGNLALLLDVASPRSVILERKPRTAAVDVVLNLPKRDPHAYYASITAKGFDSDGEARNRVVARGKSNSEVNGVDFDAESSDEESNDNGFGDPDDESYDWETQMRRRLRELEERRELEKKAEELQSQMDDGEGEEGKEETEEEKRMRVRKELEKVAQEQAERRATAQLMFELGQKAYGKGMYGRAIEFLEGALTIIPRPTLFGGEIQIWLAMAYEANNRHADCIDLYKQLEKKHPSLSIRRQAADLRYILQAPKLKISQEEMVTIPLIGSSYDSYAGTWSDKYKDNKDQRSGTVTNQLPSSRDYLGDFLVWRPPIGLEKNRAFWVGLTIWLGLVGAALILQR
ncbi:Tetratricopeptide repeat-like superfamily protein [Senna tora]|uniref:Tetratricopeptide repeat-like superfamily protein n=1 Tax=Senna tora TaxID=362788 RepID=A0A834STU0_9FABA|nr:Tetratricopeptide repeat-like superfamily protein [Senna tora]